MALLPGTNRMSRPQKVHKPLKGGFEAILAAVATGSGAGKRTARKLQAKAQNKAKKAKP